MTTTVRRDGARDISFTGDLIAEASSKHNSDGAPGRWTELAIYRTRGGKYVCSQVGRTQWQGEHDRFSGAVCETADEVSDFFGQGWLAKEIYNAAGIDTAERID